MQTIVVFQDERGKPLSCILFDTDWIDEGLVEREGQEVVFQDDKNSIVETYLVVSIDGGAGRAVARMVNEITLRKKKRILH